MPARYRGRVAGSLIAMASRYSVPQWCALGGCAAVLLWSIPGLFVNPDFAVGADASSELVLGVDMNGWHAVSGFLVVVPVLVVFKREELLNWLLAAAAVSLYGTAIWATLSDRPVGGLFYFPNPTGDVLLHVLTASIFLAGAIAGFRGRADAARPA